MQLRHVPRETSRYLRHTLLGLPRRTYWERREGARYFKEVRRLAHSAAPGACSILDVGSNGCPYLDWFRHIPRRVSLDIETPYANSGIESIRADFFDYMPRERFDLVLCLQVMEHIPDAGAFAQRLLAVGRTVITSVPYKWAPEKCAGDHVHDPVDEAKMLGWFGRPPSVSFIAWERKGLRWRAPRLVSCYSHAGEVDLARNDGGLQAIVSAA